jgi:hypothetical protein
MGKKKSGGMVWVPRLVWDELDEIMLENGLNRRVEAFDKLASFSRLGREVVRAKKHEDNSLKALFGRNNKRRGGW